MTFMKIQLHVRMPGEAKHKIFLDYATTKLMFNPVDFEVKKNANWKPTNTSGTSEPKATDFVGGQPATMSLVLRLDATHVDGSVKEAAAKLRELVEVRLRGGEKTGRPPTVKLKWGKNEITPYEFACTSYSAKFVLFAENGAPLRAIVTLGLEEYVEEKKGPNPTSVTLLPHRVHRVESGETLDRISVEHYGTPTLWRGIADANREAIPDPLNLRPGVLLAIPTKQELTRRAKEQNRG